MTLAIVAMGLWALACLAGAGMYLTENGRPLPWVGAVWVVGAFCGGSIGGLTELLVGEVFAREAALLAYTFGVAVSTWGLTEPDLPSPGDAARTFGPWAAAVLVLVGGWLAWGAWRPAELLELEHGIGKHQARILAWKGDGRGGRVPVADEGSRRADFRRMYVQGASVPAATLEALSEVLAPGAAREVGRAPEVALPDDLTARLDGMVGRACAHKWSSESDSLDLVAAFIELEAQAGKAGVSLSWGPHLWRHVDPDVAATCARDLPKRRW